MANSPRALFSVIRSRAVRAIEMVDALDLEEFLANQDACDIAQSVNHDIGEALSQLVNSFPEYVNRISNYQQIIGSRNVMSHELFGRDLRTSMAELRGRRPYPSS